MSNLEEATKFKNEGNQLFKEKKFEEAIKAYTEAIELNPADHVYFSNRSGCFQSLKKYAEAEIDAQKCVQLKPDFVKGYQRLGQAQASQSKTQQAKESFEQGLALDPNNQLIKDGLANLEQKQAGGGNDSFIQQGLMKLAMNPKTAEYLKDPDFMNKLKLLQSNPGQFFALSQSDPRLMEAMQVVMGDMGGMGDLFKNMGGMGNQPGGAPAQQEQKQESAFQEEEPKEQTRQPSSPKFQQQQPKKEEPKKDQIPGESFKQKGNQFYQKRQFDLALEQYDLAIKENPNELLFYNNKAAVFIEQKEYEKALEEVNKAIQVADDNSIYEFSRRAKIYARKASALSKLGKLQEAIDFYEKSLTEDQNSNIKIELRKCLALKKEQDSKAYIDPAKAEEANEKGKVAFREGNFPEAIKQYSDAIARNPSDAKYYCNRGLCYNKLMEFPRGLEDFNKVLEIDKHYIKALAKKGQCHFAMKEYHKALTAYQDGLKIDPNHQECKDGLIKTQQNIYTGGSKEDQEERARHAMADPEIQQILQTPEVQNALKDCQQNPHNAIKIMSDPVLGPKFQKLIAAGVLKTG